jgi:protein-disulfide isomerase
MRNFVLTAVLVLLAQTLPAAAPTAKNFKLSGLPTAPLTVEVYTDYECPSCRNLYMQVLPNLTAEYVATGKVQLLHRDFPLEMHKFTRIATKYANAAGQMGKYDLVANQLFTTQAAWSGDGSVDLTVAKVLGAADMAKIREIVKSDAHLDDTVNADMAQGRQDAVNQTPTLVIVKNGKRTKIDGFLPYAILKSYLDQLLAQR